MLNFDGDEVGRPLQPGSTDYQEVQRRYDKEQNGDINNLLSQNKQGEMKELSDKDKISYIKGEVIFF